MKQSKRATGSHAWSRQRDTSKEDRGEVRTIVAGVGVLIFHELLRRLYLDYLVLPRDAYGASFLFVQNVSRPAFLLWVAPAGWLVWRWRLIEWSQDRNGQLARLFICGVSGILTWKLAALPWNPVYGRDWIPDRLLMLFLTYGVWRHPAFIAPLLLQLFAFQRQLEYPLGDLDWTDKKLLFDHLILLQAFLLARSMMPETLRWRHWMFLALALQACAYLAPGVGKFVGDWHRGDELVTLAAAARSRGWLCHLDHDKWVEGLRLVTRMQQSLVWFTLTFELGAVLFFLHRRLAFCLLAGWIILHAGIFLLTGICFWKWVLVDLALMGLLLRLDAPSRKALFGPSVTSLFVLVAAVSPLCFQPVWLAWHDTRYDVTYQLEVEGMSGRIYPVAASLMAPYDIAFSQGRFAYLSSRPVLTREYGITYDPELPAAIRAAGPTNILELEQTRGRRAYNEEQVQHFDEFIVRFFADPAASGGRRAQFAMVAAPQHIRSCRPGAYDFQEPAVMVRVWAVRTYFDGSDVVVVDRSVLREIEIPRP